MAESIVECPICEGKFILPAQMNSTLVICPNCNRQVDLESAVPLPAAAPKPPTLRPSPEAQVTFKNAASPQSHFPDVTNEHSGSTNEEHSKGNEIRERYELLKKRKARRRLLILMAMIMAIGAGGIVIAINMPDRSSGPLTASSTAGESEQAVADDATDDSSPPDQNAEEALLEPPPKPKYLFLAKEQAEECWNKTRPHLLELKIEDPLGTHQATGTLIDSRGWVLTSYQAIKDAWKIEATAARKSLDEYQSAEPLTDLVRGIVASDPENDLAILSVNRRFVISFADVEIPDQNRIVQGEFLLQCGPPTPTNYWGKAEIKVELRGGTNNLDSEAKSKSQSMNLESSELSWFKFIGGETGNPGTPLFRTDGTLVAMTVFRKNEFGYALPVQPVKKLIQSADGELQSLKPPIYRAETAAAESNAISLLSDSPIRERVSELRRSAAVCQEFRWLPTNFTQYSALQQFGRAVGVAIDFVGANRIDPDDIEYDGPDHSEEIKSIEELLKKYKLEIHQRLAEAISKDFKQLDPLNQFAQSEIKKGDSTPVIFYGELYNGGSRLVIKMEDPETFVNVPFDPAAPVMLPESMWLYFVETKPKSEKQFLKLPVIGPTRTISARFRLAISPSDKP